RHSPMVAPSLVPSTPRGRRTGRRLQVTMAITSNTIPNSVGSGVPVPPGPDDPQLGRRLRSIGRAIFAEAAGGPTLWDRGWWDDLFMNLTMANPAVKVQLFRFIDVLPALHDPGAIRQHLAEYAREMDGHAPAWLRLALGLAPRGSLRERWLAR